MTTAELAVLEKEVGNKIQKQRLELAVKRSKNVREIFHLRKQLARIKTIKAHKSAVKSVSN